ncbi:hypothetical protein Tco_0703518 [Tanacetum coccineum]|uniref:Uncharacterized protein n=1 Tax=Tanacetum coccineum TaxID=301880 RepID=A0ABQ4Y0Y4_9ASTR
MSQDSKPKVQNSGSSKSLRPKPIQKPQLKCELYHYTNHSTDDCYGILYYMICKREDHRTDHEMYNTSLKRSENYKAQPYQEPIWYLDSGCSRSMTVVKCYLHKYVEQPGPKLCDAKYIIQFDDKQETIFDANKEIVLITPRRNDVYVLDMSSLTPNGACFFAKASEIPNVPQSHISNQASISSHPVTQGMLTRSMAAKLTAALASKCLFADFLSEIETKKVSEALKHPG